MTLLERWEHDAQLIASFDYQEIRRAIAIAQAVSDYGATFGRPLDMAWIMRRADELLAGKSDEQ